MIISPVCEDIAECCVFSTFPLRLTSLSAFNPLEIFIFPFKVISPSASIGVLMFIFVSSQK